GFGGAAHLIAVRDELLTDASIAVSLTQLVSLGVRVVNMSIAGGMPTSPTLLDAIHKAAADGVLLVAAAGNEARRVDYPAADLQPPNGGRSFGLAVGATDLDAASRASRTRERSSRSSRARRAVATRLFAYPGTRATAS